MAKNKRKLRWQQLIALMLGSALVLCGVIMTGTLLLSVLFHIQPSPTEEGSSQLATAGALHDENTGGNGTKTLHFNGVGDNLLHDVIFTYFEWDNGTRDYLPIYENTLSYSQGADLAYINFETVCAGDEYGLSGYPNFNGPLEMIDTLAQAGYDWFSTSSNHAMDAGADGLITEMDYIEQNYPGIAYTGTHKSQEASEVPVVIDVNGIKVGLAGFTYGLNGYTTPEGMDYLVDVFMDYDLENVDYSLIDERIDALQDVSDVQIVSMHWGVEYETIPNEIQQAVAKHLHDKGVEVIIGTHPHVIQPVEIIESDDQTTLCYYSLGNFLSAQDQNDRMVGGMADFILRYNPETKKTTFEEVKFIPTITYISPDLHTYRTYTISEYNNDIASDQYVTAVLGQDCSKEFVQDYVRQVVGSPNGVEVVYE